VDASVVNSRAAPPGCRSRANINRQKALRAAVAMFGGFRAGARSDHVAHLRQPGPDHEPEGNAADYW
jgi:hypothetical protein